MKSRIDDWAGDGMESRLKRVDHSSPRAEGTWWPAGRYHVPSTRLQYLLARSARHHARQAINGFVSNDIDEMLQAASSTGTAIEQLAKTFLVSINPALLADKGHPSSILVLSGRTVLARREPMNIRTIQAGQALQLVKELQPNFPWVQNFTPALDARNGALHMGLVDATQLHAAVIQMCRTVDSLLGYLELEREGFWGDALDMADSLLDEAKTELARNVEAKLAAARQRFRRQFGSMDPDVTATVLALLSGRHMSSSDHEEEQESPVCNQQGWLICGVERSEVMWDIDEDHNGGPYVERTAYPFAFECSVCNLELEDHELREVGFPSEVRLEDDDDPSEAHEWEPDEDYFRDR